MQTLYKLTLRATLALALAMAVLLPAPAQANTVTISPPRFELFGNPGDVIRETLKVRNDSNETLSYEMAAENFTASGDEGGINIDDDPEAPINSFSLAHWLTIEPARFSLEAGEERFVDVTARIPQDGEPGGHYATVQVRLAGSPVAGGGASVETRLNSLILLRVSGDITEKLSLSNFRTEHNYYKDGPVTFNLRTTNEGNVHVAPTGTIVITDIFRRKVAEIPLTQANVLPESSRIVRTVWEETGKIGRFNATVVANYGSSQQNQVITASTSFYVVPTWLIWTLAGGTVALILLITKRKSLKRLLNKITSE